MPLWQLVETFRVSFFPMQSKHRTNGQAFRRSSVSIEKMTGRTMFEKGKRIRVAVLAMLLHNKVKEAKRGHVCPSTETEDWNRMGR